MTSPTPQTDTTAPRATMADLCILSARIDNALYNACGYDPSIDITADPQGPIMNIETSAAEAAKRLVEHDPECIALRARGARINVVDTSRPHRLVAQQPGG